MNDSIRSSESSMKRVVIADDHPDMAALLARAVSQVEPGVEVVTAENGKVALDKLGQLPVDLLITDLMMPEMNGMELIEKLGARATGAPASIILITAYDVTDLEQDVERLKIDEVMLKPFSPALLVQTVRRALDGSGQTSEAASPEQQHPENNCQPTGSPDHEVRPQAHS